MVDGEVSDVFLEHYIHERSHRDGSSYTLGSPPECRVTGDVDERFGLGAPGTQKSRSPPRHGHHQCETAVRVLLAFPCLEALVGPCHRRPS